MKKDYSDTDRLDEIRKHLDEHSKYSEYNNAERDRYETRVYSPQRDIEDEYGYDPYFNNQKNVNKQRSIFGRNQEPDHYNQYYDETPKQKRRGCGCGAVLFGCCLGFVIIASIFAAFIIVAVGGSNVMDLIIDFINSLVNMF